MVIPIACIPNKINQFAYNKSKPNVQAVISNYYSVKGMEYIRNTSNVDVVDLRALLDGIVFRRGNVIWVEFGFNVGCEFGGKHPAVILKNLGEALIVAPLTSGTPNNPRPADVIIDVVYGFPKRDRYTNITRITPISVYRVDLNSSIGSINSKKMKEIFLTMKQEWKL